MEPHPGGYPRVKETSPETILPAAGGEGRHRLIRAISRIVGKLQRLIREESNGGASGAVTSGRSPRSTNPASYKQLRSMDRQATTGPMLVYYRARTPATVRPKPYPAPTAPCADAARKTYSPSRMEIHGLFPPLRQRKAEVARQARIRASAAPAPLRRGGWSLVCRREVRIPGVACVRDEAEARRAGLAVECPAPARWMSRREG